MAKRILSLALAAGLMLSILPARAEGYKHQRVYGVISADGSIESLVASVRLQNTGGEPVLRDRSDLSAIETVGGKQTFTMDGDVMVWQADGEDIAYQGKGTKEPDLVPSVHFLTASDGEEVSVGAAAAADEATLRVDYAMAGEAPMLAVSVVALGRDSEVLRAENGAVLDLGDMKLLVGFAVPGLDPALGLPQAFEAGVRLHGQTPEWVMVFAGSGAVRSLVRGLQPGYGEVSGAVQDMEALLTAVKDGKPVPGMHTDIMLRLSEAVGGLLDNGTGGMPQQAAETPPVSEEGTAPEEGMQNLAGSLAEVSGGAGSVHEGAQALAEGLASLEGVSLQLKTGAGQLDGDLAVHDSAMKALKSGADGVKSGAAALSEDISGLKKDTESVKSGIETLNTSTSQAQSGAETLKTGLDALKERNEALRAGAAAMVQAFLDTVNLAVSQYGLTELGVAVPEMTAENYAEALIALADALSPDRLPALVEAGERARVSARLEKQRDSLTQTVTETLRQRILETVLQNAKISLSAEDYLAAVSNERIGADTVQAIQESVDAKMNDEDIRSAIAEQVEGEMEILSERYMASDEAKSQMAEEEERLLAAGMPEKLRQMKEHLDQLIAFAEDLGEYTDGVAGAAVSAGTLLGSVQKLGEDSAALVLEAKQADAGAETLQGGALALKEGADGLHGEVSSAVERATALAKSARALSEGTDTVHSGAGEAKNAADGLKEETEKLHGGAESLREAMKAQEDAGVSPVPGPEALPEQETQLQAAAERLLPFVRQDLQGLLDRFARMRDSLEQAGNYDAVHEDMEGDTLYILRIDLP